jgi:orotate phosphoribosyltransferase-like protein
VINAPEFVAVLRLRVRGNLELKRLGMSIREIAEELGMKRSTVHWRLKNLELSNNQKG